MDKNKEMQESALFVMDGVAASHDGMQYGVPKNSERKKLTKLTYRRLPVR